MGRKRAAIDPDSIAAEPPPKRTRKKAPAPWQPPQFEPLYISPDIPEHGYGNAATHAPKDPYHLFKLFLTDDWIGYLCEATNRYAESQIRCLQPQPRKARPWKPVVKQEMEAYFRGAHLDGPIPKPAY
jgi:hypothetical protein